MFSLSQKSFGKMQGVHPDLVKIVCLAIQLTECDFTVLEGLRTEERQKQLVASGASKTLRSRHLTGHAVDLGAILGGQVQWAWPLYHKLAAAMKKASVELGIPVEWGGDWKSFKDGPHFQLPFKEYP